MRPPSALSTSIIAEREPATTAEAASRRDRAHPDHPGGLGGELHTALLSSMRRARALRLQFFDPALFGEPAWDILLDLYGSHLSQVRIKISSVCAESGVAATTTLRWLKRMERRGLIERCPDPNDARRTFISLSPSAIAAMDALFETILARLRDDQGSR